MSRISNSTGNSPMYRSERPNRSATTGSSSHMNESTSSSASASNTAKKKLLLSDNQLSKISKKLANIRQGSDLSLDEDSDSEQRASATHSSMRSSIGTHNLGAVQSITSVGDFSVQIQEYAVIEELLYVLMGIDGVYIKCLYPKQLREEDDPMDDVRSNLTHEASAWNSIRYAIDPTLDPSLKHLVEKLLPLATYYMSVEAFVDIHARFEYGTVNHALCSAIRVFLKEYLLFISQLEHQFYTSSSFTLQRLWFFAQDTLQDMKVLHDLAMTIRSIEIRPQGDQDDDIEAVIEGLQQDEESEDTKIADERKGGHILNILSERLIGLGGDPKCKKIYSFLLSKASQPYFEILNAWIYHGEIKDPYNEFMVVEKRNVKKENLKEDYNDTYWEMRYTIREGAVPVFLETMKTQILLAGKYLNVVRECGVSIANPEEMQSEVGQLAQVQDGFRNSSAQFMPTRSEVWAAVDGSRFMKSLEIAYKYANQTLLNLLMQDQQLIGRLRSIKHYFFLDQSDFITSFLDLAKDELKQPTSKIPQNRLQSLMDLVLRNPSSVAAYDPFKDSVKVSMSHLRLVDQLLRIINVNGMESGIKDPRLDGFERSQSLNNSVMSSISLSSGPELSGYEALILDYTVTFPLSLIISRKALTKYQLLFRHILNMKHVEDLLCDAWLDQKNALWKTRSSNPEIEHWKFRIYSLRNRMLTFVQQFAFYVTNEVLEPNYRTLETNLTTSISTVDQVLQYHSDFLDTCLKECMLTNSKLLRIFNKLIGSCLTFATQAEKYTGILESLEEEQKIGRFGVPNAGLSDSTAAATRFESSARLLTKMEESFSYHMKLLIEALNYYSAAETVEFLCLVVRLDYNQFYGNIVTRERSIIRQR